MIERPADDAGPEGPEALEDTAPSQVEEDGVSTERRVDGPRPGGNSMHWLVRIAERADLNGDRPDVPPETAAQDAWPVVARAYRVADERLSLLVAQYFRLDVADH